MTTATATKPTTTKPATPHEETSHATPQEAETLRKALDANYATRIASPLDYPGTWTQRERDAYSGETRAEHIIAAALRDRGPRLAGVRSRVERREAYHGQLGEVAKVLAEAFAAPGPNTVKKYTLELSLQALERGMEPIRDLGYTIDTLPIGRVMRERGVTWQGGLVEAEHDLKRLRKDFDDAQMSLDDAVAWARQALGSSTV